LPNAGKEERGMRKKALKRAKWAKVKDLSNDLIIANENYYVLKNIGALDFYNDFPTLLVKVGDGKYLEVWGVRNFIPALDDEAILLYREKPKKKS
jgi:hypothetical protein